MAAMKIAISIQEPLLKEGWKLKGPGFSALFLGVLLLLAAGSSALAAGDSTYNKKLEGLIQKLKTRGFSDEELSRFFSDQRLTLYPGIIWGAGSVSSRGSRLRTGRP